MKELFSDLPGVGVAWLLSRSFVSPAIAEVNSAVGSGHTVSLKCACVQVGGQKPECPPGFPTCEVWLLMCR